MPVDPNICSVQEADRESWKIDTNGEVCRRVCDDIGNAILAQILSALGGSAGTPFFDEAQTTTTGSTLTLVSSVVPASTTRKLTQVVVTCRQPVQYRVFIDSTVVGSGRTMAGNPNSTFKFDPERSASTGSTIKVELDSRAPNSEVEVYLMALDV